MLDDQANITPEAFDQLVQVKKPRIGKPAIIACLKPYPTPERVRELVTHDDETDIFRWKVNRNRRSRKGAIACAGATAKIDGHIITRVKLKVLYGQVTKRPKPSLKPSPSAIAAELRALGVPEHNIAQHVRDLIIARKMKPQPRMNNHNQTEEHEHGRT